ncbi:MULTISPECIES: helix-turn-helix domain-containing protein [Paenibacillus]|uniref:helix-turn-helix domain-containing protein n=1 Tax=Paenibacillus TaxID=44249 RepID=UPI0022B85CB4|nr:helix-turn-helix domain-containing protein [Paenibacillus caseinilyticus]MCZ8522429.1 helix-turn-helix domain-containing protein [Paenibacillus caseinilyticus]
MSRFQEWLKGNWRNTQTRLVLIMTLSVSLIIFTVGLASYYTSKSVLQSELSEPQHLKLRIGMNYIDKQVDEANRLAVKVSLHPAVREFLTTTEQGAYGPTKQLYEVLDALFLNSPYLDSIHIYDKERQSFIGYPDGYSSRPETFPDNTWVKEAEAMGGSPMMIASRKLPEGTSRAGRDQVSLYRTIKIAGESKGYIAVNFNHNALFSQITGSEVSSLKSPQFIFDSGGELVFAAGEEELGVDAGMVRDALHELGGEKFGELAYPGGRLLLSHTRSQLTQWEFVSLVSQDALLAKTEKIRDVVLLVAAGALLLGAWTIVHINSVAFQPVRRMRSMLHAYKKDGVSTDLNDLEQVTGRLLSDHDKLSQLIRQTMPEAASKFVKEALAGQIRSSKEWRHKWSCYFREWPEVPLTVAVFSIDRYGEWVRRYPDHDHLLLKYALANITEELFAAKWRTVCLDLGNDRMALLLQPLEAAAAGPEQLLGEAEETIRRLLSFSISAGISRPCPDAGALQTAMQEAETALAYRLYLGCGSVIPYDETLQWRTEAVTLPSESLIGGLADAVEAGAADHAMCLWERIVRELEEARTPPAAALSYVNTLRRRLSGISRSKENGGRPEAQEAPYGETMPLTEIGEAMGAEIRELTDSFARTARSKEYLQVQGMIEYMRMHLGDNVGVQDIASAAGISISLASQLFKQETGETIHDYLTGLRVERAGELLLQTPSKIADIATMVGYQHENSFIRVFRKYKDITPGRYRELMKAKAAPVE